MRSPASTTREAFGLSTRDMLPLLIEARSNF